MKKVIIILFIFIFMCQPVFARAGGGSSSGGGSRGHSSHTSSPHTSSRRQGGSPIAGVLGVGGCLMMMLYWKRHKARKMHQEIVDDIKTAYQQDTFWDEKVLKKKVEEQYFKIQKAWSKQDLTTLKLCLSDALYERWQLKMEWQQYQNQQNVLDNIQLFKVILVDLYDDIDNHQDYFWVYIEGKMNDTMVQDEQIIESHHDTFVEYWKFIRYGDDILLDEIKQQDEVES